jgi:predicted nucleic acid-binding protein
MFALFAHPVLTMTALAANNSSMLIDSDVLIWFLRGQPQATLRLALLKQWQISIATYMEVAQGCHTKAELHRTKKGFTERNTIIHPLTSAIGDRAANLIDIYAQSHGLRMADAIIAATAIELDLTLITANVKHFKQIPELSIEPFYL